jgi:RNA-directed DNA polymerase
VLAKLCLQAHEAGINDVTWIEELADMRKEFDVFLSHASEDKNEVRVLHRALESKGITVFFDESSIKWGDSIVEKVNHGLLKSSFFIPFLTETFAEKGFANKELNSAIQMNISRKGRILPIKSASFDLGSRYPLLNETLYKTWPKNLEDESAFALEVADELLLLIETEKQKDQ